MTPTETLTRTRDGHEAHIHHTPEGMAIELDGQTIRTNHDGYVLDRDKWTPALAEVLARLDGIELTEEHWQVILYLRDFYKEYGISPNVRVMLKHMREQWGDERVDRDHLYDLFPKGPAFQGTKYAGLPKPHACVDG